MSPRRQQEGRTKACGQAKCCSPSTLGCPGSRDTSPPPLCCEYSRPEDATAKSVPLKRGLRQSDLERNRWQEEKRLFARQLHPRAMQGNILCNLRASNCR